MFNTIKKLCYCFALAALFACSDGLVVQTDLPSVGFQGIDTLELQDDGSLQLHWRLTDTELNNLKWQIHVKEVPNDYQGQAISTVGDRVISAKYDKDFDLSTAILLAELDQETSSFRYGEVLDETKTFAFHVQVLNEEGAADGNRKIIILHPKGGLEYLGCLSAHSNTPTSIDIQIEFPEIAQAVNLYRDGEIIKTIRSASEDVTIDEGLVPGKDYEYSCEAVVGSSIWSGRQVIQASTINPLAEYQGCREGLAVSASAADITFEVPEYAEKVRLYRNGVLAHTTIVGSENFDFGDTGTATKKFRDRNLEEGLSYTYQCSVAIGEHEYFDPQEVVVVTLSSNPPTFGGIIAAEAVGNEAMIRWGVTSGVEAAVFKIYATVDGSINWSEPHKIQQTEKGLTTVLNDLGDELEYTVAVRACTSKNICDTNTVTRKVTLADRGPAVTAGAAEVIKDNTDFIITSDWNHVNGAVASRHVFRATGTNAPTDFAAFSDYGANGKEFLTADQHEVPTELLIGTLLENTTYHFIVRDKDPAGNWTENMQVLTYSVGDLSPPLWAEGIDELLHAEAQELQETALRAKFIGLLPQSPGNPTGAHEYLVKIMEDPDQTADPCRDGNLVARLPVASYSAGVDNFYTITGLEARTRYAACMQAADESGNISTTNIVKRARTRDTTPPIFSGLQNIAIQNGKIRLVWNPSPSTDTSSYLIQFWTDPNNPQPVAINDLTNVNPATFFFDIDPAIYTQVGNGGAIYAIVNACDNYGDIELGQENCTSFGTDDAKNYQNLPDLTAPSPVSSGPSIVAGDEEGELIVSWSNPVDLSDHAGFSVFEIVDGQPTESPLKSCSCVGGDCVTNPIQSCALNLTPGRGYSVTVKGFDIAGNQSAFINQVSPVAYAPDMQRPLFPGGSAGLTGFFAQAELGVQLNFKRAQDNQYDQSPEAISYNIYREIFNGTDCSDVTAGDAPDGSGVPLATITANAESGPTLAYLDTAMNSTTNYVYRIEAGDQATIPVTTDAINRNLDTTYTCVSSSDIVPPVFVGGSGCAEISTAKGCAVTVKNDPEDKEWWLSWDMVDPNTGGTAKEDIEVRIYRAVSGDESLPHPGDRLENVSAHYTLVHSSSGFTRYPEAMGETDSGPVGQDMWVHYIVAIYDKYQGAVANLTWVSHKEFSQREIRIDKITRNHGTDVGGKLIVVHGKGFSSTTKIFMDDPDIPANECTDPQLIELADPEKPQFTLKKIACTTPSWTVATGDQEDVRVIAVVGADTVYSPPSVTYRYYTFGGNFTPDNPCDDSTLAGNTFSGGDGASDETPYVVCNRDQLENVTINEAYYTIGDNIDLRGSVWSPLPEMRVRLEGGSHFIHGMNITSGGHNALWNRLNGTSYIRNLYVTGAELTVTGHTYGEYTFAAVAARSYGTAGTSSSLNFENVHTEVDFTFDNGEDHKRVGGIVGHAGNGFQCLVCSANVSLTRTNEDDRIERIGGITSRIEGYNGDGIDIFEDIAVRLQGEVGQYSGGVTGLAYRNVKIDNANVWFDTFTRGNKHRIGGIIGQNSFSSNRAYEILNSKTSGRLLAVGPTDAWNSGFRGGIVGLAGGITKIKSCSSDMEIEAGLRSGGLIGQAGLNSGDSPSDNIYLVIEDSNFSGTITAAHNDAREFGGIVGFVEMGPNTDWDPKIIITGNKFTGLINNVNEYAYGGIVGSINMWSNPAGRFNASIQDNVSYGVVSGGIDGRLLGGIVGRVGSGFDHNLTPFVIRGNMSFTSLDGRYDVGGIVGRSESPIYIENNAFRGTIGSATGLRLGGILGWYRQSDTTEDITLISNYADFNLLMEGASCVDCGGIIGLDDGDDGIVANFYTTDNVSEFITSDRGNHSPVALRAITKSELANQPSTGFDVGTWDWDDGYPVLIHLRPLLD